MAQPRASGGQTKQTGSASSARNTTPSTEGGAQPARRFSLSRLVPSRLVPSRVDRTPAGASDTSARRPGSFGGVWKLVLTMAIILIAAPIGEYIILLIGKPLKINYNQVVIGKGIPLFGGMTLFTLVYLIYIILIYVALFKFNIFPRDLFGARAKAEARARERAASRSASTTSSSARGSRRASTRHATSTTSNAPSARRVAAAARAETEPTVAGEYDAEHARVKAAQRARRRRETRK